MPGETTPNLPSLKRFILSILARTFTRRRLAFMTLLAAAFLIITPLATYAYFARDIGDREHIMNRKEAGIVLKDRNGEVFYRQGTVNVGDNTTLSEISDYMEQAVIASEDQDFYTHDGFSLRGIAGALYANVMNKDATRYGGSTITQQLVKNQLLTPDKSYIRKYQEVSMAVALEQKYTKEAILEMYLNSVYFGEGAFGIRDAAKAYFGKTPAGLTLAESAMLVGLLPAPNMYSPLSGEAGKAAEQQQRVLRQMEEHGMITAADRTAAEAQPLTYATPGGDSFLHAQHYALMVLQELRDTYGEERVSRAGFEVTTTLDLNQQRQAEDVVRRRVAAFEQAGGRNASLVAINPKNGEVLALVGSVDWSNQTFGKVNMAFAERQPGSAFKPIYYAEAIDRGVITPATILKDQPTTFDDWKPENYDFRYRGDVTVRTALALSLNIPAAEVMQKLGPEAASQAAQRMGVSTVTEPAKYGLTLALGTAETRLYEMTNAYAAFANGGLQHQPVLIQSIKDKYGATIQHYQPSAPRRVISHEASYIMSSILSDTAARAPTFGSSLNVPGRQTAAKTGTTNDNRDAWTIGYTPGLAVGVWVGNNENDPMSGLAGASSAGIIWRESMTILLANTPVEPFVPPAGIVQATVCRSNGLRASRSSSDTYTEYFIRGREPSGQCRPDDSERKKKQRDDEEHRGRDRRGGDEEEIVQIQPVTPPPMEPEPIEDTEIQPPDVGGRGGGEEPPPDPVPLEPDTSGEGGQPNKPNKPDEGDD